MPSSPLLSTNTGPLKRPRATARPKLRQSPRQADANLVLFWVLALFVVLVPVPLGSSRAYFWAVAATHIGLAAVVYVVVLARMQEAFRLPLRGLIPYGFAFTLFCLALLAQLLPLGRLFGPFAIVSHYYFGDTLLDHLVTFEQASIVRGDPYLQIIELIRLRPWTGFGGGSFKHAFPLVNQLPVRADATWDRGHDTYLTLWSELGVVAGSIPILILIIIGLAATVALGFWRSTGRSLLAPQVGALGAIVAVAIHSTVDFSLEIPANTFMFLAILAAGVAAAAPAPGRKRT